MLLLQKEPQKKESNTAVTYLPYPWFLWRFHEEYHNKLRWSKIGIWIWKCRYPSKGNLLSPQMSNGIYLSILEVKISRHGHSRWCLHQHIFILSNTCHWWIPTGIHYISLQGTIRNFCTDKYIGTVDDTSIYRTLFSKIQEHFGDLIKNMLL